MRLTHLQVASHGTKVHFHSHTALLCCLKEDGIIIAGSSHYRRGCAEHHWEKERMAFLLRISGGSLRVGSRWSQQMRQPRRNFSPLAWYNKHLERSPVVTKSITSGGTISAARAISRRGHLYARWLGSTVTPLIAAQSCLAWET